MADKEATVYVLDLGATMGRTQSGRSETNLAYGMHYIWDKITSTIAMERKTATLGVVGFRTKDTDNELGKQDGFSHISVLQDIGPLSLNGLRELVPKIRTQECDAGDAISAIVIAIQMIIAYCKRLKYIRKIVMMTDGTGLMDAADTLQIADKLRSEGIELVVVGIDFDDAEYGFKEENKVPSKRQNEAALRDLVERVEGTYGTMAQAIEELGVPRTKTTRPVPSYKGRLTLGDPKLFDSAIQIDVERYPRVMIRRPLTASNFVPRAQPDSAKPDGELFNPLTGVQNTRTYQVTDSHAPGQKRDVERDALAKGYEYGRTAVHISETDQNVTKLETTAGMEVMGFIPWNTYERSMNMSVSCIIVAQRINQTAILALSSFIHALFERELYAVARLTTKAGKEPQIVLLAPSIEAEYECLLDVQLPFTEDVRAYKFPPLDKVLTVSGKVIKEHRNLPSADLKQAMSDYVDVMDLSHHGKDDDGNPCEYMQIQDTFSPVLHRLDQAVRWRAVHGNKPVPPPPPLLTRYSAPPEDLINTHAKKFRRLQDVADVKKVPPVSQARRRARNEVKPLSGLDVNALLGREKPVISRENTIPEFKQALDQSSSNGSIEEIARQMGNVIEAQIRDSFADCNYPQALAQLSVFREEMMDVEEPHLYNDFIRHLKQCIVKGKLDGNRQDMWDQIRQERLGLITRTQAPAASVEQHEADDFWRIADS